MAEIVIIDPPRGAEESAADYEARIHGLAEGHRTTMPSPDEGAGARLAWHAWGNPTSPALVLLHGGFGSWRHWILNVVPLSRSYRVLCADLPGLGDSDRLPGEYQPERIAAAVQAGIDQLIGADNGFFVTGFSFGGIIGSHVAARAGARVRRFVAVAPGALGVSMTPARLESLRGQRDPQVVREIHRVNLGRLMLHDPARIDDLALHVQLETVRRARARSGKIPFSDAAARALERCSCPIAGIWGERDVIAAGHLTERRELFRRIQPGCPFEVVGEAGHWVMYERPDRFNAVLLDVLDR